MTDQRRADIYEQLLISEDKRVIDLDDLKEFQLLLVMHPLKAGLRQRIDALIERQEERTT